MAEVYRHSEARRKRRESRFAFQRIISEEKIMAVLMMLLNAGLEVIATLAGFIDTITC